ncbi:hypothetical protein AKJ09_07538 [Labilithrix luteola]|uniref:Uncharacterized protein n=1 Tax=Labilithrix luteola TaxID=1391654 RepID=A0A0K1Q645_9BACT|nr:hypothetical protein AKJ09_07538 [Labilithrix luteola]
MRPATLAGDSYVALQKKDPSPKGTEGAAFTAGGSDTSASHAP